MFVIKDRLANLKYELKIYEEDEKLYVVFDNDDELNLKIDKLILSELEIQKEGIIQGHGNPLSKKEILKLFDLEKSICKISYENFENNQYIKG